MPLLNFQARFADQVERGEKCQTIRAYRKDGRDPKPGDTLYLYTGCRTKQARKLAEVRCSSVQPVQVIRLGLVIVPDLPPKAEREAIAQADGFGSEAEMLRWFEDTHGLPFDGLLIRWEAP